MRWLRQRHVFPSQKSSARAKSRACVLVARVKAGKSTWSAVVRRSVGAGCHPVRGRIALLLARPVCQPWLVLGVARPKSNAKSKATPTPTSRLAPELQARRSWLDAGAGGVPRSSPAAKEGKVVTASQAGAFACVYVSVRWCGQVRGRIRALVGVARTRARLCTSPFVLLCSSPFLPVNLARF